MDIELREFLSGVGGSMVKTKDVLGAELFKRDNYAKIGGRFCIIKISRNEKPFWGLGKTYLDALSILGLENYFLVLLTSNHEGWVYSKTEIERNIRRMIWKLREQDKQYKINFGTLDDRNLFTSHSSFLERIQR